MSLTNPNKVITEERLSEFYQGILPYLGGSAEAGFTPVGTIISIMGNSAPANYLACNGQIVNIADYIELANYFEQQFESKNKFGGDGTTTFGIPDLRGEFLRGTGTNSHTNQGSGGNVGEHQDATEHLRVHTGSSGGAVNVYGKDTHALNVDTLINPSTKSYYPTNTSSGNTDNYTHYTARPTNTSVLYCIATKNIYLNPSLDYSTDEKVVGTWIDGRPLYQKIIVGTLPNCTTEGTVVASNVNHGITNVDLIFIASAFVKDYADWPTTSSMTRILPYTLNSGSQMKVSIGRTQIQYANGAKTMNGSSVYSVAQYTKTTDA